jgi:dolichyl-phosphate beta-glucosyltransferase
MNGADTGDPGVRTGAVPELSIVVPCYRCATTIGASVDRLRAYLPSVAHGWEILLVDDGSGDGTPAALEALADGTRVRTLSLEANRGKGAAVAAGMRAARGRCRIFTDADLPYRLVTIERCVERVGAGHPAVFGNRRLPGSDESAQTLGRRTASVVVRGLVGVLLGRHDVDTQCGLKAFSGPLADILFPMLRVEGFLFDVELTLLLTRAGIELDFLPVTLAGSDASSVRLLRTGLRTVRESWQLWRGRRRRAEDWVALSRFAGSGAAT